MEFQNQDNVQWSNISQDDAFADANPSILYLSLDKQSCKSLGERLAGTGITLVESQSIYHVQQELVAKNYAVCVIRCLTVNDTEFEFLQFVKKHNLNTRIIISTKTGTIDLAVRLMKVGAGDFVVGDAPDYRLAESIIQQTKKVLEQKPTIPQDDTSAPLHASNATSPQREYPLIGTSQAILDLHATIELVSKSKAPVLITGESGTGKEIVARHIHILSERSNKPWIALNCAALPHNVIENELFGHEKGAFSGAISKKIGYFELADQGTLFLDEIGEMDLDNQAKLLRVLETQTFRRLGGNEEVNVDVKMVAASNKHLPDAIVEGLFRQDLYYRLSVIEIEIPPLRERREDIKPLIEHFLGDLCKRYSKNIQHFSDDCMEKVLAYNWPGNVRELRNTVERSVVLCQDEKIGLAHIPNRIRSQESEEQGTAASQHTSPSQANDGRGGIHIPIGSSTQDAERLLILQTMASVGNNKSKASELLKVSRKTLHNKIHALFPEGIEVAFMNASGTSMDQPPSP